MGDKEYMPQLDSLRALSVVGVAWAHWAKDYTFNLPLASGVQLFFVLSGFLITNILFNAREKNELYKNETKAFVLRGFYGRRFLRILPLFYVVLVVATIYNVSNLHVTWPWHYFYASNYYFIYRQGWHGAISHFWTLAVEEQFYFIWPFVILFTPWSRMSRVLFTFVILGICFRFVGDYAFSDIKLWSKATPGSFDSLALGALLSYFKKNPSSAWLRFLANRNKIIAIMLLMYVVVKYTNFVPFSLDFLCFFFLSVAYACLISMTSEGITGFFGKLLNLKVLVYLGSISYGLYIFHNFAIFPTGIVLNYLPLLKAIPGVKIILNSIWTILVSILSWHLFEAPLNKLKKYFPYNNRSIAAAIP